METPSCSPLCICCPTGNPNLFPSVQAPEKYSRRTRAIQGMREVNLSLWICEFLLFFAGDGYNYKPQHDLWNGSRPANPPASWREKCSHNIKFFYNSFFFICATA
jgi:hypothetical protein